MEIIKYLNFYADSRVGRVRQLNLRRGLTPSSNLRRHSVICRFGYYQHFVMIINLELFRVYTSRQSSFTFALPSRASRIVGYPDVNADDFCTLDFVNLLLFPGGI